MTIDTKKELGQQGFDPIKHRGQNFLVSPEIIEKIINSAQIKTGEIILEVGPGTGNLTEALLKSGAEVVAVEKDRSLTQLLKIKYQNSNIKIIEGDILKFSETKIKKPYRIIANIPYYLTGALIQKFLLSRNKPTELILMVQKEVGERLAARPPKANYLSSLVQFIAKTEILLKVGKENFWPQPKVDSVVIKLTPHQTINVETVKFFEFLKVVFKQPRQTLFNNLRKSGLINMAKLDATLQKLGLDKKIRPQNLDITQLQELFLKIHGS
ncbi:MAG: ribosomal RNA small subunit methyltransferase A [Candidatus Sungbacteria bacterium]|uniref:Ribosomal RNA small subunit methyltransferase A n=1 Tax=Candidatus Sungiibacteriota bacterium TaxID=2750080 RepID=A0A932DSI5_9BACT|nr:ribosomal RNA small subunit methyltransferase A [Candidatus Sungbacteria bacterium]